MLRNLNQSSSGRRIAGTPHSGVLAAAIPVEGDFPALGLNDIDAGDPAGCEYRVEILTWPAVGTLLVAEDTSFTYEPPSADFVGVVGGTQRIWKSGAAAYDETYSFTFGSSAEVSADLAAAYQILSSVSASIAATYGVEAYVGSDLVGTYSVAQMVGSDLAASYAIEAHVSSDLIAAYEVDAITFSVSADVTASYGISQFVHSEVSAAYGIESVVSASLIVTYSIGIAPALHVSPKGRTFRLQPAKNVILDWD